MNARELYVFDAHCHIDPGWKAGDEVIPAADRAAGRLFCGVGPSDWQAVAEARDAWPGTVAAFGIHPWHAGETGSSGTPYSWCDRLAAMLRSDSTAWVGEIGLDGLRTDAADRETQRDVFARQLRLAARLGRRVNLHCVRAWEPLMAGLDREYLATGGREGFIVHAFAGPHQTIDALGRRGAYFTVGPLAWKHDSRRQEERVRRLPEDRLLLESDEFLTPGRDRTDALYAALAWLAGVRGMSAATLAARIEENVRRLFSHV